MADRVTQSIVNQVKHYLQRHSWAPVLAIYASARVFSFFAFLFFASIQEANYWTAAHPAYFDFLNIWDVEWYHKIYTHGYPVPLPTNPDGSVQNNEWAFFPAFPYLIKALNWLTAVDWKYLAPIVATIFGFLFIIGAYRLLRLRLNERTTLWAIAIVSFAWASPVLQVGYADSMQLFFITVAIWAFVKRRDVVVALAILAASLTRPGTQAFALMFLILAIIHRKDVRERWRLIALTAISGVFGFLWLVIAWVATGRWNAYLETENSWRAGFTGKENITPFLGWFQSGGFFIGQGVGQVFIAAMVGLIIWVLTRPSVRALGQEIDIWSISYIGYLFVVFFPQASTPRILFPAWPVLAALGVATVNQSKWAKGALLAASIGGQLLWLWVCWKYTAPDYTPP